MKAAALDREHRWYQEAVAAEKEQLRLQEVLEWAQNVRGGEKRELEVVQQSRGGNKEAQGSRITQSDEEKAVAIDRVCRQYQEAVAVAKEQQRQGALNWAQAQEDLEEALQGFDSGDEDG